MWTWLIRRYTCRNCMHAMVWYILMSPRKISNWPTFGEQKFFTCWVAWAFILPCWDHKDMRPHQTTYSRCSIIESVGTSEVGQHQCTISRPQYVNIYSVFPELGSHWMADECCDNALPTHSWWLPVCSSLRRKKKGLTATFPWST